MKFLVAIDGVPDLSDQLLERLAKDTRRPEAEWKRALAAPSLGRIVLSAATEREATTIAERLAGTGLTPHVIGHDDATSAVEQAFEATWAEPAGDGILFIGPAGEELKAASTSIRLVVTGVQVVGGERKLFVVLGLRDGAGAVIVRLPGTELSKIVKHAEDPDDVLEAFLDFLGKRAPHAPIERNLERHPGKLSGLDEIGTTDLAHAGVIAAWLLRRFPPPKRAPKPQGDVLGESAPTPVRQLPSLDVAVDHRRAARDLHAALPEQMQDAPPPAPEPIRVSWRDKLPDTPAQAATKKRNRMIAAALGAVVLAAVAFSVLHTPEKSEHLVHPGESWKSPYGVTFTFADNYNAGIADVADIGFVIDVEKGGDKRELRFPAHEAKLDRDAFGTHFRLTNWDDTTQRSSFIVIEARR